MAETTIPLDKIETSSRVSDSVSLYFLLLGLDMTMKLRLVKKSSLLACLGLNLSAASRYKRLFFLFRPLKKMPPLLKKPILWPTALGSLCLFSKREFTGKVRVGIQLNLDVT